MFATPASIDLQPDFSGILQVSSHEIELVPVRSVLEESLSSFWEYSYYKGLLAVVWGTGVVLSSRVMTARSTWDVEMRSINTTKELCKFSQQLHD
jgi:hypothetical protein